MKRRIFSVLLLLIASGLILTCGKKNPTSPNESGFPPPLGEIWTYRVIGTQYVFSLTTEPVNEKIGGYVVYRIRRTDTPPGLGDYIGYDAKYGEVWVATDSWDVNNPSNFNRQIFQKPIPTDLCPYGTKVGTIRDNGQWVGQDDREVVEVLAYEAITVP
jgi:hypothetical protein